MKNTSYTNLYIEIVVWATVGVRHTLRRNVDHPAPGAAGPDARDPWTADGDAHGAATCDVAPTRRHRPREICIRRRSSQQHRKSSITAANHSSESQQHQIHACSPRALSCRSLSRRINCRRHTLTASVSPTVRVSDRRRLQPHRANASVRVPTRDTRPSRAIRWLIGSRLPRHAARGARTTSSARVGRLRNVIRLRAVMVCR